MTEDVQDMEDILSSIKSILEEDENKQAQASKADLDVDVLDDVLNASSDDDILELSPDMMISENNTLDINNTTEAQDVVLNDLVENSTFAEINPVAKDNEEDNIVDMVLSEDNDRVDALSNVEYKEEPYINSEVAEYDNLDELVSNGQEDRIDIISDGIAEEPTIDFINEIIAETNQEEIVLPVDEYNEEMPITETTDILQDEFIEQKEISDFVPDSIVSDTGSDDAFINEFAIDENNAKFIDDMDDDIPLQQESDKIDVVDALEIETTFNDGSNMLHDTMIDNDEVAVQDIELDKNNEDPTDDLQLDTPYQPIYEANDIVEELEIEPSTNNTNSHQDTTDVSANIISNFAKMFSREENTPVVPVESTPEVTSVGNASKTLEEFVLNSVIKVVGKEISQQWNNGSDFKTFAENEIVRQTKEWINDNLPSLVEKVVKQEIERVIAKVGS